MTLQSAIAPARCAAAEPPSSPQSPVSVQVITYAPVAFFHCQHCELIWQESPARLRDRREQVASSLPPDLAAEYQAVSDWVRGLAAVHGGRLKFRIVDAASLEGWFKSLRYGVRRYPAVIVDGKEKVVGAPLERATHLIERRLAALDGEPRFRPPIKGRLES